MKKAAFRAVALPGAVTPYYTAPSSRLLFPSRPQIRRQPVQMDDHHPPGNTSEPGTNIDAGDGIGTFPACLWHGGLPPPDGVVGPKDIQPHDVLFRDFGDEHPNPQGPPFQGQLDEGHLEHWDGLPKGHLQNVGLAWLSLGLSYHVGPGEGY